MIWGKDISWNEVLFILSFLLAYAYYYYKVKKSSKVFQQGSKAWLIKFLLRSIYFSLFIIALLSPSFGVTELEQKAAGKDVYFCIDVSKSMDASDVPPSRLEQAKSFLKNINKAMPANRTGLIIFSSDAAVRVPLTFDDGLLDYAINQLNTQTLESSGTHIKSALKLTAERLQDGKPRRKVLVLITDGEDFGDLNNIDSLIKDTEIILVGVGTEEGYLLKVEDNEVMTALNINGLENLAQTLESKLFILNTINDTSLRVLEYIDNLKTQSFEERTILVTNNKYRYFLFPGLLLLILDALLIVKIFKV